MRVRLLCGLGLAASTVAASTVGGSLAGVADVAAAPTAPAGVVAQAALDPVAIALEFLTRESGSVNVAAADIDGLVVSDVVPTEHNGLTNVYVQQQQNGIDIFGANVNVAVTETGSVLSAASRLVTTIDSSAGPQIGAVEAAESAAIALQLESTSPFRVIDEPIGIDRSQLLSDGGVSRTPIPARLVYQQVGDQQVDETVVRLAWELTIETLDGEDWWQIRIDAATGAELDRNNLVVHEDFTDRVDTGAVAPRGTSDSSGNPPGSAATEPANSLDVVPPPLALYQVYAQPVEAPSFGARTDVEQPADDVASPLGWHDTNGAAGAEFTFTQGNNVSAYTDTNDDNLADAGSQPDGGAGLQFLSPLDLAQQPSSYKPAAVTNLFYWNNTAHDFLYAYGFDEAAGNFQQNNYGRGGIGNDAVRAEAQDKADFAPACNPNCNRNNANFATPPDGSAPRMQMYLWTQTNPNRDGDLDSGIILHEFGHGLSNRLTGGPSNVACLNNQEQAGEGWSDYLALVGTMRASDTATQRRGIGTWALGQLPNGNGLRAYPYSTDMAIDPRTYNTIKSASVPHGVGSTFTAMLWEMTWALIDQYGFDSDLAHGSGGNNIATQLVVDGLKLQPCSPGFVDARNAILLADQANNGGVNNCLIWEAFAKRGLGFSADQGSPASRLDGVQAFDVHPSCTSLGLTKTASPSAVQVGGVITYTLTVVNNEPVAQTGVTLTDPVPVGTTYRAGSAQCGGSLAGGVLTFALGTLAPVQQTSCSFQVVADPLSVSVTNTALVETAEGNSTSSAMVHTDVVAPNVPSAPTGVSGVSGNGEVTVSWSAPPSAPGDSLVTGYQVSASPGGAACSTSGALSCTVSGLVNGQGYTFAVNAINIAGPGPAAQSGLITPMAPPEVPPGPNPSSFVPLTPARVLDTRSAAKVGNAVGTGAPLELALFGRGGLPGSGIGAVALNVTVVAGERPVVGDGYVTVYPCGTRPEASNLNFSAGQTIPNAVIAPVSASGRVCFYVYGSAHLLADVSGYFPVGSGFSSLTPARVLDTRSAAKVGNAVGTGAPLELALFGRGGLPGSGIGAVALNVTVVAGERPVVGDGYVTVYPCGTRPEASNLNFSAGQTIPNAVIAPVSASGRVCFYVYGSAHLLADVSGYFPVGSGFSSLTPARVLDTRSAAKVGNAVGTGAPLELALFGRGGLPGSGIGAVALNVTVVAGERPVVGDGYVTVYPCGTRPEASNLNFSAGQTIPNAVIAPVSASGRVCFYVYGSAHLLADVSGYFPS